MKKIFITTLTLLSGMIFLNGCTANLTEPEIDFKPPVYVEQMPAAENRRDYVATGSVFGQGESPLFSDHKAMYVNDIVTVSISENTSSSNTAAKQLSESDEMALGGIAMTKAGVVAGTRADIGLSGGSSSSYKGSGSATKDASFSTTVSARIVKVLENGNYFIAGKREILVDDQKQVIQISGVIRPFDIDQYNKIDSNQMSEAKILYKTEGDVDRAAKQGWGTKIIQAAWPF